MTEPPVRVGAVDIGSNTVRLLVADVADPPSDGRSDGGPDGRVGWLDRRAVVTRLAEGVDRNGRLTADAVSRTLEVLAGYRGVIDDARCEAVRAVATSAVRDAADRGMFLDRAEEALGTRPEVVSGDEEATLTFAGATGTASGPPPYVVIDPGGGSTEIVAGARSPELVVSIDIGSVRLTERLLPRHPAAAADLAAARRHVDELLTPVTVPPTAATVIGVAGTFTSLAAIHRDLAHYDPYAVDGTVLEAATLEAMVERLAALTVEETAAIPSLDPRRAPVLLGGAIVAERVVARIGAGAVTVSERDNLDGIALGAARSGH